MDNSNSFKKFKISFCTTCMGRLHHVMKTMPNNIKNMMPYGNIEFLLLNYNSNDKLDQWVEQEMKEYIDEGILIYLKTFEPTYWDAAHAKNIVTQYATGDIICNVDSDNFLEKGFAGYVNECFNSYQGFFLTGRTDGAPADAVGRICMWKSDFIKMSGYDEKIVGYGYEDTDLYMRLIQSGVKEKEIKLEYIKSIEHGHDDRVKNTSLAENIDSMLVYESKTEYKAIVLKKDATYEYIVLIPNWDNRINSAEFTIREDQSHSGKWIHQRDEILLKKELSESDFKRIEKFGELYVFEGNMYMQVQEGFKMPMFFNYSLLINQRIHMKNREKLSGKINEHGFGKALIYRNFNYEVLA